MKRPRLTKDSRTKWNRSAEGFVRMWWCWNMKFVKLWWIVSFRKNILFTCNSRKFIRSQMIGSKCCCVGSHTESYQMECFVLWYQCCIWNRVQHLSNASPYVIQICNYHRIAWAFSHHTPVNHPYVVIARLQISY